ncbi:hypothetical protein F2Q70_00031096 [Brassica cretica]|uniref:Uncharacterized protein n=1 Tax=Brassica cretica TaxID=69181 RepID=A0A8S9FKJ4_BRACR|nr:hypothetical protein F2Q70_00031096 [Brassica cretica]
MKSFTEETRVIGQELEEGRYAATEHMFSDRALPKHRYDISPCVLVYPSMLSPEDRSKPISRFPAILKFALTSQTRVSRFNLDPWPLAPATRFSPALDIYVESTYLRHSLLHVSLCYLLVTGSISLAIWRKEVPTDATTKTRASNLRRAATCSSIPSFGPSSSDELRGFSRRHKALVFGFISCRTSLWRLCPSLSTVYGASFSTDELNLFVFGEARVPPTTVCCSSSSKQRQILQYHSPDPSLIVFLSGEALPVATLSASKNILDPKLPGSYGQRSLS